MFKNLEMKEMVEVNGGDSFIDGVIQLGSEYIAKTKATHSENLPNVSISVDKNRFSTGMSLIQKDGRVGAGASFGPYTVDVTFKY